MLRPLAAAVLLACAAGCSPSAQVDARAPNAKPPGTKPPTAAKPTVPPGAATDVPGVAPEIDALLVSALRRDPRSTGQDYPGCPPLSMELRQGVAREVERSQAVRMALLELDPAHDNNTTFDAVATLRSERAAFSLAAGVCHDSDDVKIKSARALAELADPGPLAFLLEVADRFAVFESGSENATLHGVLQHALAAALNGMTAEHVKLGDGQDPTGLRAGIDVWRRHGRR